MQRNESESRIFIPLNMGECLKQLLTQSHLVRPQFCVQKYWCENADNELEARLYGVLLETPYEVGSSDMTTDKKLVFKTRYYLT